MNFSPADFVTVNEILADVLKIVGDTDFKKNSPGWYTSQVRQALQELSYDTFFDEHNKSFPVPENLRLEMPKGSFNLKQVYLFNGTDCDIRNAQVVYHKRNFINDNSGSGYVARDRWENENDPFHKRRIRNQAQPDHLHYFGVQNGLIMLSPSCSSFDKVLLVYNGVSTDIKEVPVVPNYLRQAVKGWVAVEAISVIMASKIGTQEYTHWFSLHNLHDGKLNHPYEGDWVKAERRVSALDNKHRQDMKEYFSRLNY